MRKKLLAVLVSAVLCGSVVTASACGSLFIDTGEEVDTAKSQLYVHNYNGGVGSVWLNRVIERFEKRYAETSFAEGKVGVQVIVSEDKQMRADLENTLKGSTVDDVYFAEHSYYASWAEQGLLLDITDVVQGSLAAFGEEGTIEDKLSAEKKSMLTSTMKGNGYYALPHYEGFQGVSYNVTLFDKYGFYFNTDGNIIGESSNKTKSAGPDNIAGTSDDGLPASLEQFAELCSFMVGATSVKPFVWTGMYNEYFTILLDALTTSVLGKEATEVLYSFNEGANAGGEVVSRLITGFSADSTPQVGTAAINETTGYLLWQREELYYVLDFAQKIFANGWYTSDSINGSYDHLMAQEDFVEGTYDTSKEIAMLIDGNYWENEASDAIARSESTYRYDYESDSNFAWMPLPTTIAGDEGDSTMTLRDSMQAYAFIHANVPEERKEIAKLFLQFCYTDESLVDFTLTTGMTRDVAYDLSDAELSTLTKYAQSIWNYRKTADKVNTDSTCTVFHANEETLTNTFWRTQIDTTYDRPYLAFYTGGATARTFFEGLAKLHTRTNWDSENRSNYHFYDFQTEENITPVS